MSVSKLPITFFLTQSFLPGGGGLEVSTDYIAREMSSRHLSRVEIICISQGDNEGERKFDRTYPLKIHRIKSRFVSRVRKFSQNYDSIVGGPTKIGFKGKISMLVVFLFSFINLIGSTSSHCRKSKDSLIFLHCMSLSSLCVAVVIRTIHFREKINIVFSDQFIYQKSNFMIADKTIRYLFNKTDAVVCISKYSADQLVKSFGVERCKISISYIWFTLPKITNTIKSKLKEKNKRKIKILSVGRLIPEKGTGHIIELAKYIHKNKLDNKFSITVIGDSKHQIKDQLVAAVPLYPCLKYLGRIEKPELWSYFASHDVFLIPLEGDEGFGRVIAESYSLGTAAVAVDRGATGEVIDFFTKGIVLKRYSNRLVIEAIERLYSQLKHEDPFAFLKTSRAIVRKSFSKNNFSVYEKIYTNLTALHD